MTRTVQLRRYRIVPGAMDDFRTWFAARLVPARRAHGFRVEFAYAIPESDEFVWAVSVDGDAAAFDETEKRYLDSPERKTAFKDLPQRVSSMTLQLVEPLPV